MRVVVAGANGAAGRRLVPMLVARGHQVTGTTTSETSTEAIRAMGAEPVVVDGIASSDRSPLWPLGSTCARVESCGAARCGPSRRGMTTTGSIYRSEAARAAVERLYDEALTRVPFATESRMVATRFGDTHVLVAGTADAPPVVVLQGGNVVNPLTLAWFAPLADQVRIYAPDTIGQPGKSAGRRISANDTSLGDWATDVLDGLGLVSASFVGISYGAGVLLRLAAAHPERIDRAVLVVPAGIADVPLGSMLKLAAGYLSYRAVPRRSIVVSTVRQLTGLDPDPLMVESTALAFRGTQLDTEMPRNATADELRGLSAPVMVFAGERDPLFPPARVLPRARDLFPNLVAAETLTGCAHILSETCAAGLCTRIGPFLVRGDPALRMTLPT